MIKYKALLTLQLAIIKVTPVRSITMSATSVSERTYSCSDGVKLAVRRWANFDDDATATSSSTSPAARRILCLHGWLDNAASYNRLAPLLMESFSTSPTELIALDFPGHGLSSHKSVDGPPQLLAEYAYYVAELVNALDWGSDGGVRRSGADSALANIKRNISGKNNGGGGDGDDDDANSNINVNGGKSKSSSSNNNIDSDTSPNNESKSDYDDGSKKIILCGHSMGSAVSIVLCAAFPEWFSSLILLEGGLASRNANDAARHVRAACQRRLRSNRTLFPNASSSPDGGGGISSNGEAAASPPRTKVYSSINAAIEARLSTATRMPGDQYLSFEAAREMVARATAPAKVANVASERGNDENDDDDIDGEGEEAVVFRHDPRLQWPSLQYYTREQVEAFMRDVHDSDVPVCLLYAADGWPVDSWAEGTMKNVLAPGYLRKLSGSHHFHADPDTVDGVAKEVITFLKELSL